MADGVHVLIPASEYAEMESKIERLEKALDKACAILNGAITNEYYSINKECNLIEAHIEPFMTIKKWKEWCMKDVD